MKMWKKVLIGSVSVATLGAGVGTAAIAGSKDSGNDRPGIAKEVRRVGDVRHGEAEPRDDKGVRETEARGRVAEGEAPRGANDREAEREANDQENDAEDRNENEATEQEREDRSGPSDNSGPGHDGSGHDDSGHDDRGGDN